MRVINNPALTPLSMPVRAQLSPECTDLLNRIFVIDEKKRITVPEIKQHAWYTRPLLPRYAEAEAKIAADQRKVEEYIRKRDLDIVRHEPPSAFHVAGHAP